MVLVLFGWRSDQKELLEKQHVQPQQRIKKQAFAAHETVLSVDD
jgi:hypothetical protein